MAMGFLVFSVASWFQPRRVSFDRWSFARLDLWIKCLKPLLFNLFIDQYAMPLDVWYMSSVLWMILLFDFMPTYCYINQIVCFAMNAMSFWRYAIEISMLLNWLISIFLAHFSCIFDIFRVFFTTFADTFVHFDYISHSTCPLTCTQQHKLNYNLCMVLARSQPARL